METVEGLEIWRNGEDLLIVVLSRAPTGVYSGWTMMHNRVVPMEIPDMIDLLTSGQVEWADIRRLAKRDQEFRSHKAASKWARRALSRCQRAAMTPEGYEPAPGWVREYNGDLTLQNFDAMAKIRRAAEKIIQLEREIEAQGKKDIRSMTDTEYRAHRARNAQLKRERAKLQGGDNA